MYTSSFDRRVPLCVHDGAQLECASWVELRVLVYVKHHVWCSLRHDSSSSPSLPFSCSLIAIELQPELFPTKDRGTGVGIAGKSILFKETMPCIKSIRAATANRIFGVMSPIVALYADLSTPVPIYVSGALFIASGLIALLLPFETRGKASL